MPNQFQKSTQKPLAIIFMLLCSINLYPMQKDSGVTLPMDQKIIISFPYLPQIVSHKICCELMQRPEFNGVTVRVNPRFSGILLAGTRQDVARALKNLREEQKS